MFGSKPSDFENTARELTQEWQSLTTDESSNLRDNGFVSVRRECGETRVIRQTYYEGKNEWHVKGKSYYWQPTVGNTEFEGSVRK